VSSRTYLLPEFQPHITNKSWHLILTMSQLEFFPPTCFASLPLICESFPLYLLSSQASHSILFSFSKPFPKPIDLVSTVFHSLALLSPGHHHFSELSTHYLLFDVGSFLILSQEITKVRTYPGIPSFSH
jgi:hypothetical protein